MTTLSPDAAVTEAANILAHLVAENLRLAGDATAERNERARHQGDAHHWRTEARALAERIESIGAELRAQHAHCVQASEDNPGDRGSGRQGPAGRRRGPHLRRHQRGGLRARPRPLRDLQGEQPMRTYNQLWADAKDEVPFPNGTSAEFWFDRWCAECANDPEDENEQAMNGCPLILISLNGRTPAEWVPTANPSRVPELGDCSFDCALFRHRDDGPDPEPKPIPDPPGQDAMFPREAYEGARMFRDVAQEVTHVDA